MVRKLLSQPDKRGIPVFVFEVKPLDSKTMTAYAKSTISTSVANSTAPKKETKKADTATTPPRLLRLFALYEFLAGFCLDLCSVLRDRPYLETPISQSNNIVDISGVGLKQFWNLRSHMQDASVLATAHYPETLDRIFVYAPFVRPIHAVFLTIFKHQIVGAPTFFPTVWGWIKRWFDPITVSKIFILSDRNVFPTLSTFIDPENIPKKYGGKLDFKFGQLPTFDPAYSDCLVWKDGKSGQGRRLPEGPLVWIKRDQEMDLMAVGSAGGKERREVLATLYLDRLPTQEPSLDSLPPGTPAVATAPQTPAMVHPDDTAFFKPDSADTSPDPGDALPKSAEEAVDGPGSSASEADITEGSLPPTAPPAEPAPLSAMATDLPASSTAEKEELANGQV